MTTPTISHWLRADITLKHKQDLSTYKIKLTNRATISDTSNDYFPILLNVSRLGSSSDREIVLPEAGSIRILDSIGSLGVDRKFSDLLERYEIVDQPITILYKETEVGDNAPVFGDTEFFGSDIVFAGKVLDYDSDIDRNLPVLEIRFDSRIFEKRVINKIINTTDHTSAPLQSIGKALPVVFGEDVQVKPEMITAAGATNPQYAYATTLNNEHAVGGVQTYYVRDLSGDMTQVLSASNVATAVLSQETGASSYWELGATYATKARDSNVMAWYLEGINFSTNPYIITQVEIDCAGYNDVGKVLTSGSLVCEVYTKNSFNLLPDKVIARGEVTCSPFQASIRGASDFRVAFAFNEPVIMHNSTGYFLAITQTDLYDAAGAAVNTPFRLRANTIVATSNSFKTQGGAGFEIGTSALYRLEAYLYGVKMTDTATGSHVGSDGLGDAYYELSQRTAVSGYSNPDISKLNWIVKIDGIKDDSGGNITGSASSVITRPHHAIKLLSQEWGGSAWTANSYWDFDSYSATHNTGYTFAGALEGEYTLQDAIQEICQNTAYKIVLRKNGKLAPYAWGSTLSSVARFTQENSKVIRHGRLDSSYVVNNIKIGFDKQLIYFNPLNSVSQGISADYAQVLNINSGTAGYSGIIGNSEDLYSERFNLNNLYNLVNTSTQATRIADYLLRNFSQPPVFVVLEVPFDYYADLELQNVTDIKHPSLPTYYGGSPNVKLPHYDGEEIDVNNGNILSRAKLYRAQLEGLRINFNEDAVPTLQLTCRLLLNASDPT